MLTCSQALAFKNRTLRRSHLSQNILEEKETYLYDSTNLIGDVGGFLGLLLGVSAMTAVDWIVKLTDDGDNNSSRDEEVMREEVLMEAAAGCEI